MTRKVALIAVLAAAVPVGLAVDATGKTKKRGFTAEISGGTTEPGTTEQRNGKIVTKGLVQEGTIKVKDAPAGFDSAEWQTIATQTTDLASGKTTLAGPALLTWDKRSLGRTCFDYRLQFVQGGFKVPKFKATGGEGPGGKIRAEGNLKTTGDFGTGPAFTVKGKVVAAMGKAKGLTKRCRKIKKKLG